MAEVDPIIKSFNLIQNAQLRDLFLLQYPARPANKPYTATRGEGVSKGSLKPKAGILELEVPLRKDSNYNEDRGRDWRMDKIVLSGKSNPIRASYAIGVTRGNDIHLTPVNHQILLRAKLDHLPSTLPATATTMNPRAITMSAKTDDTSTDEIARHLKEIEEEEAIPLVWHDQGTYEAGVVAKTQLYSHSTENLAITATVDPEEYIDRLFASAVASTELNSTEEKTKEEKLSSSISIKQETKATKSKGKGRTLIRGK